MKIDIDLAMNILEILSNVNGIATRQNYNEIIALFNGEEESALAYLRYLQEGGFIQEGAVRGNMVSISKLALTYHGSSVLMENGGLEARKNIVTIYLSQDFFQRLEDAIKGSHLQSEEKHFLLASIKRLPSLSLEQILSKLLDAGLDHLLALLRQL